MTTTAHRAAPALALLAALALAGCGGAPAGPAAADPPGARTAVAADLTGVRWLPADGTAQGRAYAEFAPDGTWTGSDGCNGQSGGWTLHEDGALDATSGMSTLIGCENVPVARWIDDAVRAEVDGPQLLLHDAGGGTARLVRAPG